MWLFWAIFEKSSISLPSVWNPAWKCGRLYSVVGDLQEAMRRDCLVAKDRLANDPRSSNYQQELLEYMRLKRAQSNDS